MGGEIIKNNDLQLSLVSERNNDLLVLRQVEMDIKLYNAFAPSWPPHRARALYLGRP